MAFNRRSATRDFWPGRPGTGVPGYLPQIATRLVPQVSGRVGILSAKRTDSSCGEPAERRILRRGLLPRVKVRSGGTPEGVRDAHPTRTRLAGSGVPGYLLRSLRDLFRGLRERRPGPAPPATTAGCRRDPTR